MQQWLIFQKMKVWDAYVCSFCIWSLPFTLPETNILHQKMDHWKRRFPLDTIIFRGYVSFREGVGRILQIIDFRYLVDQPVTYLLIRALVEFQSSLPAMSSASMPCVSLKRQTLVCLSCLLLWYPQLHSWCRRRAKPTGQDQLQKPRKKTQKISF